VLSSRLVLIGPRGSGKSTVGRILAAKLGWSFIDADEYLETAAGRTIAAIFKEEGEAGFRDREASVLADLCGLDNIVVASGGGVVLRPANRARLRQAGYVVWLQIHPETAFSRLQADPTTASRRPNLTLLGGLEELRAISAEREPMYRESADFALDVSALSPEAAANAILAACRSRFPPSSGLSSSSSSA
jgi:shikimate kinase